MSEQGRFIPISAINSERPSVTARATTETGYSHGNIEHVLSLSNHFFASEEGRRHVYEESEKIAESMRGIDGFVGSFATGFPFFLPLEGGFRPHGEITRFLNETQAIVAKDADNSPHGWHCPDCQVKNNLPDLKTLCKPCEVVDLKPRDVFKAVPDVDVFVIAEDTTTATRKQIETVLQSTGRSQSDTDIAGTIDRSTAVFEAIRRREEPEHTLPVDIHLLSRSGFTNGMNRMLSGELGLEMPMESLHMTWEPDKIPFGYDFILQLTLLDFEDQVVLDTIHETRRTLKETYGEEALIDTVASVPRGARLLEDEVTRNHLEQRLADW